MSIFKAKIKLHSFFPYFLVCATECGTSQGINKGQSALKVWVTCFEFFLKSSKDHLLFKGSIYETLFCARHHARHWYDKDECDIYPQGTCILARMTDMEVTHYLAQYEKGHNKAKWFIKTITAILHIYCPLTM